MALPVKKYRIRVIYDCEAGVWVRSHRGFL